MFIIIIIIKLSMSQATLYMLFFIASSLDRILFLYLIIYSH